MALAGGFCVNIASIEVVPSKLSFNTEESIQFYLHWMKACDLSIWLTKTEIESSKNISSKSVLLESVFFKRYDRNF